MLLLRPCRKAFVMLELSSRTARLFYLQRLTIATSQNWHSQQLLSTVTYFGNQRYSCRGFFSHRFRSNTAGNSTMKIMGVYCLWIICFKEIRSGFFMRKNELPDNVETKWAKHNVSRYFSKTKLKWRRIFIISLFLSAVVALSLVLRKVTAKNLTNFFHIGLSPACLQMMQFSQYYQEPRESFRSFERSTWTCLPAVITLVYTIGRRVLHTVGVAMRSQPMS
jgi:hypothetical protein